MKARPLLFTELELELRYQRLVGAIAVYYANAKRPRDLNEKNIALAFHRIAVAADHLGSLELAHGAAQLAYVWNMENHNRCTTVH